MIAFRSPATDAAQLDLSNKYHEDCSTFMNVLSVETVTCTKRAVGDVSPYPFVEWAWQGDHSYRLSWHERQGAAVGTIIIQNTVSHATDISFVPVNGMQYETGTKIGDFLILYIGSEYATETAPIVPGQSYVFKILHFDENFTYGLDVVWDITR